MLFGPYQLLQYKKRISKSCDMCMRVCMFVVCVVCAIFLSATSEFPVDLMTT